jgi:hypothetical protein
VGINDVNVFQLQPLERRFGALNDMFARETMIVDKDLPICQSPIELTTCYRVILQASFYGDF